MTTEHLFQFLESACLDDGGDGDVLLISPEYLQLADQFEQQCDRNYWTRNEQFYGSYWTRKETENVLVSDPNQVKIIYFNNGQENIWFSDRFIECHASSVIYYLTSPNHFNNDKS